ncbi:hypothetical protein RB195_014589 [Necator americanus]|uniref:Uncharacterized protein n=1 Tax=Necator americanus TaxID=51031 RepID=A0ABR1E0W9_NECAM
MDQEHHSVQLIRRNNYRNEVKTRKVDEITQQCNSLHWEASLGKLNSLVLMKPYLPMERRTSELLAKEGTHNDEEAVEMNKERVAQRMEMKHMGISYGTESKASVLMGSALLAVISYICCSDHFNKTIKNNTRRLD